jgi:hypothetical protein
METIYLRGMTRILWNKEEFDLPSAEQIQAVVPLHPYSADLGPGLTYVRRSHEHNVGQTPKLVHKTTTARNLALVGTAMCMDPDPPAILICGPQGSGKFGSSS